MNPKHVVLVEYFVTDSTILLLGVRAGWAEPQSAEVHLSMGEIRGYVEHLFGSQGKDSAVQDLQSDDFWDEFQVRLAPLVEPILRWAEPDDYVCLVPHDVLHYLPLHALKVAGCYLGQRNPVLYVPSASLLKHCQSKRKRRSETGLILGDSVNDLIHARIESDLIAALFGTQPYVGQFATKTLLKKILAESPGQIDVLHFACHGKFDPVHPLGSGIEMASEEGQRDASLLLTAEEIFGMTLNVELVTLSACNSGVNQVRPGDELFGLMRALIFAGTPSILMSKWAVDDVSGGILMQEFYRAWKTGHTKVEALRIAQMKVKEMTAGEALQYCVAIRKQLEGRIEPLAYNQLTRDIGDLHYQAKNFAAAREIYASLSHDLDPASPKFIDIAAAIGWCARMERNEVEVDYAAKVYASPFYWAPFVLIGDWE